ncbi:MAG: hypothetical protein ABIV13_03305 [Fimbriimonadales bacterium]
MLKIATPAFVYHRVRGMDRIEWLQGQLTQNVLEMRPGDWRQTAALNATGQLLADGALWVFDDEVVVGFDRFATGVQDALASRIIMEDVVFEPIVGSVPSLVGEVVNADDVDYEAARVEAGMPLAGIDYDSKTLAMEMGPHFISTRIALDKGCYTGQEIVERIRSRGHTNKQWVGLQSESPIPDSPEARITSRAESPRFGHIALAFVKTDLAAPGTLIGAASVVPLPFR